MNQPGKTEFGNVSRLSSDLDKIKKTTDELMHWYDSSAFQQIAEFNRKIRLSDDLNAVHEKFRATERYREKFFDNLASVNPLMDVIASIAKVQSFHTSQMDTLSSITQRAADTFNPNLVSDTFQRQIAKFAEASRLSQRIVQRAPFVAANYPSLQGLLSNATLDKLDTIAAAAASRVQMSIASPTVAPTTLPEVRVTLAEADLEELKTALTNALATTAAQIIEAIQPKSRQHWMRVLAILWGLLLATYQIVGQPLFERMLDERTAAGKPMHPESTTPALSQLAIVTVDQAFVRAGPHTQQRYIVTIHRGDVVRVVRRLGLWTLVVVSAPEKKGVTFTGWVKKAQISALEAQASDLLNPALASGQL